jgi:hypothetical protein
LAQKFEQSVRPIISSCSSLILFLTHFGSELSTILEINRGWDSPKQGYSRSALWKTQLGGVSLWESDYVSLRFCGTRSRKNQPRGLNPRRYSTSPMLGVCCQPTSSSHHSPVIFVSSSTNQAYLIVTAIGIDARPRKPMRAPSPEKRFKKFIASPLITILPKIEPTLEEWFGPAVEQVLKIRQENIRRLGFR